MKTLILLILPFSLFAQLDEYGQHFKDNVPAAYEVIKQHAAEKWVDDFTMVVYQINKQCKAAYEFLNYFGENQDGQLAYKLIMKWGYKGYENRNKELIEQSRILEVHTDWGMVFYEYKKQIEAKSSY